MGNHIRIVHVANSLTVTYTNCKSLFKYFNDIIKSGFNCILIQLQVSRHSKRSKKSKKKSDDSEDEDEEKDEGGEDRRRQSGKERVHGATLVTEPPSSTPHPTGRLNTGKVTEVPVWWCHLVVDTPTTAPL